MAITTLPYPNMDFVPLDVLTADELDQIVANIDAVNNAMVGAGSISNGAITTAKIADDAITSNKIDWTTLTSTDLASSITGTPAHSGGTNDFSFRVMGNIAILQINTLWQNAVANNTSYSIMTIPSGYRPAYDAFAYMALINGDSGALAGHARARVGTDGVITGYSYGSRSGLTSWRGQVVWFIR